ncbi:MAG: hypothetical protein ACM3ZA_08165 [Bacillota bacterium]
MSVYNGYYGFPVWPAFYDFFQKPPPSLITQVSDQEESTAQSLQAFSSLGQFGQVGAAGESWMTADTLSNIANAQNVLRALGLAGPTFGLTPMNMAFNTQYAQLINATASQLSQANASLAMIRAGSAAILAQAGRQFLGTTYS